MYPMVKSGFMSTLSPTQLCFSAKAAHHNSSYCSDSEHSLCSLKQPPRNCSAPSHPGPIFMCPSVLRYFSPRESLWLWSPLSMDLSVTMWLALGENMYLPLNDKIRNLWVLPSPLALAVTHPRRNTICFVTTIMENLIGAFLFITCLISSCGSLSGFARLVATDSVSSFNAICRYCGISPQIRKVKLQLD